MNKDLPVVEVKGLSKKFCKDLKTSLWYGLKDLASGYAGNKSQRDLRPKEFWAVKDISFQLRKGECLGLIGHNGAGKSTLLKILNGLINPDEGKVVMRGRVGALIELGAGFNPILTGRENIYNNGAVLGFTRKEIDEKLESIIDFSELREFIDMPVQNYSSGMKVRLGFAVAAQMEPDILIIDEVLAVGDLGFVLKCYNTIDRILPNTAVIFVSHSMPMISRMCNKIILMDKGESKIQGPVVSKAIDLYYTRFSNNSQNVAITDSTLKVEHVKILSNNLIEGVPMIEWGSDFQVNIKIKLLEKILDPSWSLSLIIMDKEQRPVAIIKAEDLEFQMHVKDGFFETDVLHKNILLSKGIYSIDVVVKNDKGIKLKANSAGSFQITHPQEVWAPFLLDHSIVSSHA